MSTLKDIAKEAGVSIASVSRYVNNKDVIKSSTRERIQKAIEKLNYRPNLVARSLKLRSSNTVALIFADIKDPFFSYIANKAEQTAHDLGFSVILCNTEYSPEKEMQYIELLKNRNVDGYLILTTVVKNSKLSAMLKNENVVFVDQSSGFLDEVFVKLDNKEGVNLGIDHLVQKGHRDIGVINLTQTSTTGLERFEGYKAALKKHGIPYNEKHVKFSKSPDWTGTSYYKTEELLRMKNRPTALFPMNGATTIGALHAIRKNGLIIPDDISIIGFDEYYFSDLLSPGITTIAQPVEDFGETGMNLLINIIKQELPRRRKIIELKPELIVRNSCKNIL
ncbi:LacI family DNA-binding transcriptional regulator [Candidatus Latescibacterota bacterium]